MIRLSFNSHTCPMFPCTSPAYDFQWRNLSSMRQHSRACGNDPEKNELCEKLAMLWTEGGTTPWTAELDLNKVNAASSYAPLTQENIGILKNSTQTEPEGAYSESATSSDKYLVDSEKHLRARYAIAYYTMYPTREFKIHKWLHDQRELIRNERVQDPKLQEWLRGLSESCGGVGTKEVGALRDRLGKIRRRVAERQIEAKRSRERLQAKKVTIRRWLEDVRLAHPAAQRSPPNWMSQFNPAAWEVAMQQITGRYVPLPERLDDPQ
ncbi:hypothetical protein PHLGIDRAFT_491263 [Phlebiopsis gigantea 11061_1 CR5-6]|uniref:Uncharacterized protein n=1 Tax=Phlebiopsis gigantea (strain 11061_1 CR5-6) TaxID=745531 RepID=A0A0C3S8B1_PHLG1|nr:hypothetical protein PHLGIDRAFT_491263 [Phlebiopsis gigantea 11061_1 CR5-6]